MLFIIVVGIFLTVFSLNQVHSIYYENLFLVVQYMSIAQLT